VLRDLGVAMLNLKGLNILGIAGKKGSGKTTLTRNLQAYFNPEQDELLRYLNGPVRHLSFSSPVKQLVSMLLDIPVQDFVNKETIHQPSGKTYREILQLFGTDWMRSLDEQVWVRQAAKTIRTNQRVPDIHLWVIDDVRFPNEIEFIHSMKGKVIYLYRGVGDDAHSSENSILSYDCDFSIDCRNLTTEDVRNTALNFLQDQTDWIEQGDEHA